jgi:polyhydroxyalkanoate synthesis regulator phasin
MTEKLQHLNSQIASLETSIAEKTASLKTTHRERAITEAFAKAEGAEVEANRERDELQSKIDYLRTRVREIAAA